MCGSISDVNDPAKSSFTTFCRCILFPVQWLSSFFTVLFILRAHHTDNSSRAKKAAYLIYFN